MKQNLHINSNDLISGKRYLLLTFDYELFLGTNSGSAEKCMIEPTKKVLEILKENEVKHAIFFVDTTYLQKLIDSQHKINKTDFNIISQQLIHLLKEGHYVFPHIHPHWKNAVFDEKTNRWNLENASLYRFHFLSEGERDTVFKNAIDIIKNLQKEAGVLYDIDAYRAGGWCIQPFSDFKHYFEKYEIKHDFSVLKGHSNINEENFYNFADIPSKSMYKYTNEVNIEDEMSGKFYEFTISSLKKSSEVWKFCERIFNKYLWLSGNKSIGNGYSISKFVKKDVNEITPGTETEMASLELLTIMKLNKYLNFLKNENYLQIISHPKMLSNHNLKMFDRFLKSAKSKYDLITDYKLMLN